MKMLACSALVAACLSAHAADIPHYYSTPEAKALADGWVADAQQQRQTTSGGNARSQIRQAAILGHPEAILDQCKAVNAIFTHATAQGLVWCRIAVGLSDVNAPLAEQARQQLATARARERLADQDATQLQHLERHIKLEMAETLPVLLKLWDRNGPMPYFFDPAARRQADAYVAQMSPERGPGWHSLVEHAGYLGHPQIMWGHCSMANPSAPPIFLARQIAWCRVMARRLPDEARAYRDLAKAQLEKATALRPLTSVEAEEQKLDDLIVRPLAVQRESQRQASQE